MVRSPHPQPLSPVAVPQGPHAPSNLGKGGINNNNSLSLNTPFPRYGRSYNDDPITIG